MSAAPNDPAERGSADAPVGGAGRGGGTEALLAAATAVAENAYAPYSGFHVGAALRTASGRVFAGCNVENAAYPEGTCAEAGAIAAMVAAGEREIAEVAVIAGGPTAVPPCGGCRQKLAEFAGPGVPVTLASRTGARETTTVGALLPGAFGASDMETP
jgi:cytidine deaminase